jgi:hypothetical protein
MEKGKISEVLYGVMSRKMPVTTSGKRLKLLLSHETTRSIQADRRRSLGTALILAG